MAAQAAPTTAPFVLPAQPDAPDLVAKYFRGLGDATRVRILGLLEERGELSVSDLVAAIGKSQSKVSNHLACLRWCGFVEARREHRLVLNRIADERVVELLDGCRALVVTATEEFGIAAVEAQASGRPVVALAEGGVCETVEAGRTGAFYAVSDPAALAAAVEELDGMSIAPGACRASAARFDVAHFETGLRAAVAQAWAARSR